MPDDAQDITQISVPDAEAQLIFQIRDQPASKLIEEYTQLRLNQGMAPLINMFGSDLVAQRMDTVRRSALTERRELMVE